MSLVFLNNLIIYTTEYEISYNNSPMKYSNGKLILIHFPQGPREFLFIYSIHLSIHPLMTYTCLLLSSYILMAKTQAVRKPPFLDFMRQRQLQHILLWLDYIFHLWGSYNMIAIAITRGR